MLSGSVAGELFKVLFELGKTEAAKDGWILKTIFVCFLGKGTMLVKVKCFINGSWGGVGSVDILL